MKNIILKYGIIFGILASISGILFLRGTIGMGLSTVISFGGILLTLFLAGMEYKKSQDGFASFGELLKLFMGIIAVVVIISIISSIANISILDEATKTEIADNFMEGQRSMYESMGMNEEIMDEMEEELEEQAEKMFDIGNVFLGSAMAVFMYFLLSMIPAGILKKN